MNAVAGYRHPSSVKAQPISSRNCPASLFTDNGCGRRQAWERAGRRPGCTDRTASPAGTRTPVPPREPPQ